MWSHSSSGSYDGFVLVSFSPPTKTAAVAFVIASVS